MGNEANCQKFCDHQEEQKHQPSQIKMNQYPLECQICHKEIQHTNFKRHLDLIHYASIQEKNQHIYVICLLCEGTTSNLQDHNIHLAEKHCYCIFKDQSNENKDTINQSKQVLSNKLVKSKIKELQNLNKINFIQQIDSSRSLVEYQQKLFQVHKKSKQYDGMQYDEVNVFAQLVLFPIFTEYRNSAQFYFIQKNALQKTIQCTSYILCSKK